MKNKHIKNGLIHSIGTYVYLDYIMNKLFINVTIIHIFFEASTVIVSPSISHSSPFVSWEKDPFQNIHSASASSGTNISI